MARQRTPCERIPLILTGLALALAVVFALLYPWRLVALYVGAMLPVPLTLLWASRSAPSPAERIAQVDAEHAHAS